MKFSFFLLRDLIQQQQQKPPTLEVLFEKNLYSATGCNAGCKQILVIRELKLLPTDLWMMRRIQTKTDQEM